MHASSSNDSSPNDPFPASGSPGSEPHADAFPAGADPDSSEAVEAATQRLRARLQRIAIAAPDAPHPDAPHPDAPHPDAPHRDASETGGKASDSTGDSPASNGLAKLVLTLVQLLHDVLERQAVRRMEEETLTPDEVERVGQALMAQAEEIERLCEAFGLDPSDLDIPLGTVHVDEPRAGSPQ